MIVISQYGEHICNVFSFKLVSGATFSIYDTISDQKFAEYATKDQAIEVFRMLITTTREKKAQIFQFPKNGWSSEYPLTQTYIHG